MTRRMPDVVVTGLGAVSPAGVGVEALWDACLSSRTATRALGLERFAGKQLRTRVGAPLVELDLAAAGYSPREAPWLDLVVRQALVATSEALSSAGLEPRRRDGPTTSFEVPGVDPLRTAVVVSSGMGGLGTLEAGHLHWITRGRAAGSGHLRQTVGACMPNAAAAQVALRHGFQGECKSVSTACAAGTMSVGEGLRLIAGGEADIALVGGTDAILSDHDGLGLFGFDALGALSATKRDPATASRPFDTQRDGFVLADGAAVLVLEAEAHARARGAPILARLLGYAATCQAHSIMQPEPTGRRSARVLSLALERAGVGPSDIGLHVAHATSTPAGDVAEARALRHALGSSVGDVLVTAPKGVTGHAIAAAGALESVLTVLCLARGVVPPTANLDDVGADCELRHVRGAPIPLERPIALKASFGFGGHDAAIILAGA